MSNLRSRLADLLRRHIPASAPERPEQDPFMPRAVERAERYAREVSAANGYTDPGDCERIRLNALKNITSGWWEGPAPQDEPAYIHTPSLTKLTDGYHAVHRLMRFAREMGEAMHERRDPVLVPAPRPTRTVRTEQSVRSAIR